MPCSRTHSNGSMIIDSTTHSARFIRRCTTAGEAGQLASRIGPAFRGDNKQAGPLSSTSPHRLCHQAWLGAEAAVGQSLFRAPSDGGGCDTGQRVGASSIRCCMGCVTKISNYLVARPGVGDGSGSRCSCGVSFSAPAVSWGRHR